jgi:hypothetical protein
MLKIQVIRIDKTTPAADEARESVSSFVTTYDIVEYRLTEL